LLEPGFIRLDEPAGGRGRERAASLRHGECSAVAEDR